VSSSTWPRAPEVAASFSSNFWARSSCVNHDPHLLAAIIGSLHCIQSLCISAQKDRHHHKIGFFIAHRNHTKLILQICLSCSFGRCLFLCWDNGSSEIMYSCYFLAFFFWGAEPNKHVPAGEPCGSASKRHTRADTRMHASEQKDQRAEKGQRSNEQTS
jgi:hypothetical protein